MNRYAYVGNRVLNFTDPVGLRERPQYLPSTYDATFGGGNCTLGGMATPCGVLRDVMNAGAAVVCLDPPLCKVTVDIPAGSGEGLNGFVIATFSVGYAVPTRPFGPNGDVPANQHWDEVYKTLGWILDISGLFPRTTSTGGSNGPGDWNVAGLKALKNVGGMAGTVVNGKFIAGWYFVSAIPGLAVAFGPAAIQGLASLWLGNLADVAEITDVISTAGAYTGVPGAVGAGLDSLRSLACRVPGNSDAWYCW
jgi:hypothetical protein